MEEGAPIYVQKACAYITNRKDELLVFRGPGHEGFQVPKGTIEPTETPREAVYREVAEESGITLEGPIRWIASDVWTRRRSPLKRYIRHFFHATVSEHREEWTHTVTGKGSEVGSKFEYSWVQLPTTQDFALALDDYVNILY